MAVYGKALARPSPFLSPIPAPIVAGRRLISMRGDTRCSVRAETEMWESQSCHRFRDFFQKRVAVDRFDFRGRIRERGKVARDGAERRVTAYHIFRQEIHKGQIADIAIIGEFNNYHRDHFLSTNWPSKTYRQKSIRIVPIISNFLRKYRCKVGTKLALSASRKKISKISQNLIPYDFIFEFPVLAYIYIGMFTGDNTAGYGGTSVHNLRCHPMIFTEVLP